MSAKHRKVLMLATGLLCMALLGFLPLVDHLPHPETVAVQLEEGLELPLHLSVVWYDLGLNRKCFSQTVELDASGRAKVPDVGVPAPLWRIGLKRVLSWFDAWTKCEHCYGPWVDCSLELKENFRPPENTRLAQDRIEAGTGLVIKAALIPNESKFETRDFRPRNSSNLVAEARALIAKGSTRNIPRSRFGPELSAINPVRVECRDSALILWMGGKTGYALAPDTGGCPALNRTWVTSTEHPLIFKLEKMQLNAAASGAASGNRTIHPETNRAPSAADFHR